MFSGMASLSLSSALWLTAMAANPLGAEIARTFGVEIGFGSWLRRRIGADARRHGRCCRWSLQRSSARR